MLTAQHSTAQHSTALLSYSQLYLALPVEFQRAGADDGALAIMVMVVSGLVITLQLPINHLARRCRADVILPLGFMMYALGFAVVALTAPYAPPSDWSALLPALVMMSCLAVGQMIIKPVVMDMVPAFAQGNSLGVYYGALASAGGVAVLGGNALVGGLLDAATVPSEAAAWPWWVLAILPLASALALYCLIRCSSLHTTSRR